MFVRPSCKARNNATSTSFCIRGHWGGRCKSTCTPLLFANPSTYHRAVELNPASFKSGGGNKWEIVRVSLKHFSTISEHSDISKGRFECLREMRSRLIL